MYRSQDLYMVTSITPVTIQMKRAGDFTELHTVMHNQEENL